MAQVIPFFKKQKEPENESHNTWGELEESICCSLQAPFTSASAASVILSARSNHHSSNWEYYDILNKLETLLNNNEQL